MLFLFSLLRFKTCQTKTHDFNTLKKNTWRRNVTDVAACISSLWSPRPSRKLTFSVRTSLKTPSSACFVPGGRPLPSVFVSARSEAAGRRPASRGEPLSVTDQPAVPRWQEPPSPPGRSTSPTWITSRSVAGCGAEEDNLLPERPSNSSPEVPSQRRVEVLTLKEESHWFLFTGYCNYHCKRSLASWCTFFSPKQDLCFSHSVCYLIPLNMAFNVNKHIYQATKHFPQQKIAHVQNK